MRKFYSFFMLYLVERTRIRKRVETDETLIKSSQWEVKEAVTFANPIRLDNKSTKHQQNLAALARFFDRDEEPLEPRNEHKKKTSSVKWSNGLVRRR